MEFHPAAAIFPMLEGDEYEAFRDDIKMHGLKEPIVTFKSKIIDGRNRFKACRELGIKPLYTEWDGEGSLVEYVVSLNLHRRHLTTNQRGMLGAKIMDRLKEEAKERMYAGVADPAKISRQGSGRAATSSERAASVVKTSAFPVEKAQAVLDRDFAPLTKAVEADQVAIHNAADLAKLPDDELRAVIGAGPDAMLAKAQELRSEKKEATTATPKRETQPVASKGAAAVKKWLDDRVEYWAKSDSPKASICFEEASLIRKGLCEVA